VEVVASLSQGCTAAAQCGLFTHKSVPVIFEPPCNISDFHSGLYTKPVVFWVITAYSALRLFRSFGETYCLRVYFDSFLS